MADIILKLGINFLSAVFPFLPIQLLQIVDQSHLPVLDPDHMIRSVDYLIHNTRELHVAVHLHV